MSRRTDRQCRTPAAVRQRWPSRRAVLRTRRLPADTAERRPSTCDFASNIFVSRSAHIDTTDRVSTLCIRAKGPTITGTAFLSLPLLRSWSNTLIKALTASGRCRTWRHANGFADSYRTPASRGRSRSIMNASSPSPSLHPTAPAVSSCPFCRSSQITTTSKSATGNDVYWRCSGCGEIWNPSRLETQRGGWRR